MQADKTTEVMPETRVREGHKKKNACMGKRHQRKEGAPIGSRGKDVGVLALPTGRRVIDSWEQRPCAIQGWLGRKKTIGGRRRNTGVNGLFNPGGKLPVHAL